MNFFYIAIDLCFGYCKTIFVCLGFFLNKKINTFVQFSTARLSQAFRETICRFPFILFLDQHSSEISKNILNEVARAVETVIYPFCIAITSW